MWAGANFLAFAGLSDTCPDVPWLGGRSHYTRELRLSILIPTYNERTVVERSLAQVLAAGLPEDKELIIVGDCSTDGTAAILDRVASQEPCIRLVHKDVNQGR
jgi:cellulose synthase/poly-beta-1,6-N-acetylglucosamine synthase-like glycosyltransferase